METVKKYWNHFFRIAKRNYSLVAVVLGVFLGLIIKFFVPLTKYSRIYMNLLALWHLQMLHVVTTPLICIGVILGACDRKVRIPGDLYVRATVYRLATTFLSATLGLMLVLHNKPGVDVRLKPKVAESTLVDSLLDVVLNIVPTNIILDTSRQHKTVRTETHYIQRTNIFGLIVWAYIVGKCIRLLPEDNPLQKILAILKDAATIIVNDILGFLPLAMILMAACVVVEAKDWALIFKLGKFMTVALFGLIVHATLVLPLIYFIFVRRNPYPVIKGVFPAIMTAFLSSSSTATLPLTFKCCEERLKVDKEICRLLLPNWTNTNINGSVIYEVIAAIFIAQLNHLYLDFSQLIVIVMLSAIPCLGGTGTPTRGATTTFLNLTVAGLLGKEACLLVFTQYLLDRCNTCMNVLGDCFGVALLQPVSVSGLEDMEEHSCMALGCMTLKTPNETDIHISSQAFDD